MQLDEYGYAEHLTSGVRCGNHPGLRPAKIYHDAAETVRYCYAQREAEQAEQRAEQAVELAYERHLEDAGWREAEAQERYEQQMGMISFQEAWQRADLENGPGYTGPRS
jgi:hypothetical protein